eukprot:m.909510 g.909510  ORF g.909510 m.909510 type:complete len:284 (+) comp23720_c0_seq18:295-1146(+)
MCIIFFKWHPTAETGYKLILAANRDEYFSRPTKNAQFWIDTDASGNSVHIISGCDLQHVNVTRKGTWLGVSGDGKVAGLTNYRCAQKPLCSSRGLIPSNYLCSRDTTTVHAYADRLMSESGKYNGFNFIAFNLFESDHGSSVYMTNMEGKCPHPIPSGDVHAVTNKTLDDPWPKLVAGKAAFAAILDAGLSETDLVGALMDMLSCTKRYPAEMLPQTGMPIDIEVALSSIFVECEFDGQGYGTRAQTVILIDHANRVTFVERSRDHDSLQTWQTVQEHFVAVP